MIEQLDEAGKSASALGALHTWAKNRYGFQWRLRSQVLKFIRSHQGSPDAPRPFAGRGALLGQLDQWLAGTERFKLLSGPAGRGKSALLLQWLDRVVQRNDVTVLYVPISLRFGTAGEKEGVELLFTACCDAFPALKKDFPRQSETSDYLGRIGEAWRQVDQHPERSYLLVIDGVDEALHPWLSSGRVFPDELPSNLHLLISARHKPGHSDGIAWLKEMGLPGIVVDSARRDPSRWVLELTTLDQAAMAEAVIQLGRPLDQLAGRRSFSEQLYRLTDGGDPLLLDLWLGEIWKQRQSPPLDADALERLKPGLGALYTFWLEDQRLIWEAQGLRVQEDDLNSVMRVLAVAKGPLQLEDVLAVLSCLDMRIPWDAGELREVLRVAHRLVIADGDTYVFVHPRLADHFEAQTSGGPPLRAVREAFLRWGARIVQHLNGSEALPMSAALEDQPECSPYLLHHYVSHLETDARLEARAIDEYYLPLLRNGWARAWYTQEGAWTGYLNDLGRVCARLVSFNRQLAASQPGALYLAAEVRCLLLAASIRSLTLSLPGILVAQLAREGIWSLERASRAAVQHDPEDRALCLAELGTLAIQRGEGETADIFVEQALEALESTEGEASLAPLWEALAVHLRGRPERLQQALQLTADLRGGYNRAFSLDALAPLLQGEPALLQRALFIARGIEEAIARVRALGSVAAQLDEASRQEVLQQALHVAWNMDDEADRALALRDVGTRLEGALRQEVFQQVLQLAVPLRSRGQLALLRPLVTQLRGMPALLQQVLQLTAGMEDDGDRVWMLDVLARQMQGEPRQQVLEQALQAAAKLGDADHRAQALGSIASQLAENQRHAVLQQALQSVREIQDVGRRGTVLEDLVPRLQGESALQQALEMAEPIDTGAGGTCLLLAIAAQLHGEARQQVLQRALRAGGGVQDRWVRSHMLRRITPHLQGEPVLLRQALRLASSVEDAEDQVAALGALVVQLQGPARRRVLQQTFETAIGLKDESGRAHALQTIAALLQGESTLLRQALKVAVGLESEKARSQALIAVAAQLRGEAVLQEEALQAAALLTNRGERARVLCALATQFPEPARLQQGLAALVDLPEEGARAHALSTLAPHLNGHPALQQQAFEVAAGIEDERARAFALEAFGVSLPGQSPERMWDPVLQSPEGTRDERDAVRAQTSAAGQLQGEPRHQMLQQALEIAVGIERESVRSLALGELAGELANERDLQQECLKAVQTFVSEGPMRIHLSARLIQQNPALMTYELWSDLVRDLNRNRSTLLSVTGDLSQLAQQLTGQGAPEDIAVAIGEVGEWFP